MKLPTDLPVKFTRLTGNIKLKFFCRRAVYTKERLTNCWNCFIRPRKSLLSHFYCFFASQVKIVFCILFVEMSYYVSTYVLDTCLIDYLMALSNNMQVATFFMFWWYVYLFLTLRSPVSREIPRYSIAILSAPYTKLYCLKIMMMTKCETKGIKSKVILHKKLYCTFKPQFFHWRTIRRIA